MRISKIVASGLVAGAFGLSMIVPASAASTVVVTPAHTQGWSTADTRPGGSLNYITDSTSPYPSGALELTTDNTDAAKVQYMHAASTPLSDVTELSYFTKQVNSSFYGADPSYQVVVELNGTSGFSTLVYEPYQNPGQGAVVPGMWQKWDVTSGLFWSTRTVTCSNGTINGAPGGPATYTLADIKAACPDAVVIGFGVNVGTYNAGWDVETDGVNFNGTTYDFQVSNPPTSKEQCKDGGYQNLTDDNGQAFSNQGQCVSFYNHE